MSYNFAIRPDSRIYIAGHSGLVGSAIWRHFKTEGFQNLIGWRSSELDLRDASATMEAVNEARPEVVIIAAARVGGIAANNERPVEFLLDNLKIQNSIIEASHFANVPRLLFLGSSCIYPKFAEHPIKEESLLTGELEPTNDAYAIAKIAGIKLIQSYRREYGHAWISAMPTNLYGPGDNYDQASSHVLAALVRRFTEAVKSGALEVEVWGTGAPKREFLHSADLARAVDVVIQKYDSPEPINVGTGKDLSIKELAELIAKLTGFTGQIIWNKNKPDGTPRKLLSVDKLSKLGWRPEVDFNDGLRKVCEEYSYTSIK